MYQQFVRKHTTENLKKLYQFQKWLQVIGKRYGAQKHFFRNEAKTADTSALPPIGKDREPYYIDNGKKKNNNLRLYCLRANESIVFLFSGDIKTADKAQLCPNVKPYFDLANQLTKAINQAFKDKDIIWNEDATSIELDPNFELNY